MEPPPRGDCPGQRPRAAEQGLFVRLRMRGGRGRAGEGSRQCRRVGLGAALSGFRCQNPLFLTFPSFPEGCCRISGDEL